MTFEVIISNKQRGAAVDMEWLQASCPLLAQEIWRSLSTRLPRQLSAGKIKEMSKRGSISLTLVSDRQIRKLNKLWRGKDAATDVLSFPLDLEASPEVPWQVGEIIISVERAAKQADDFGHSLKRELAFLFVHGFLHVLGFDHEKPAQEKEMFSRQDEILKHAGFVR